VKTKTHPCNSLEEKAMMKARTRKKMVKRRKRSRTLMTLRQHSSTKMDRRIPLQRYPLMIRRMVSRETVSQ